MVYVYCRKPDNTEKESPISIIQKWVKDNNVAIDEIVFDDEVKQKDSFEKRKLGRYIIPKLKDGDILLTTEVSCLARSAIELDRLFNTVLRNTKVRVVCISLDIDVDYVSLSLKGSSDLKHISFAANLQNRLATEYTKAALAFKRIKGVKMGAASAKYQANKALKSKDELKEINAKKGHFKNINYLESKDIQTLFKIFRVVYGGKICKGDPLSWSWELINTKGGKAAKILELMKAYNEQDSELFKKWDFSSPLLLRRFRAHLESVRNSVEKLKSWNRDNIELSVDNNNESNLNLSEEEKKQAQGLLSDISNYFDKAALTEDSSNDTTSNILDERMDNDGNMSNKFGSEEKAIKISSDSILKFRNKK